MAHTSYAYSDALELPQLQPEVVHEQPQKKAAERKVSTKLVTRIVVTAFFLLVFSVVLRSTIINEMTAQNNSLEKHLQELTAANEQSTVYLDSVGDLKSVETIAQSSLDMGVPQSHQVINVTLNMKDKTVKPQKQPSGFMASAKNFIAYCLEYLY